MICIFEVFALNRNEDDFLENLGILNEIRLQNEDSQINTIDDSDIEGDDRQHLIQNVPAPANNLSVQPPKDADAAKVLEFETVEKPQNEFQRMLLKMRDKIANEAIFKFMKEKLGQNDKKAVMLFKCYKMNSDEGDLINSMQVLFNKSKT